MKFKQIQEKLNYEFIARTLFSGLYLLFATVSLHIHAQADTVNINITGSIRDKISKELIPNAKLTLIVNENPVFLGESDSLGHFSISVDCSRSATDLYVFAEHGMHLSDGVKIDATVFDKSNYVADISMEPVKRCWDSFLPDPILFSYNSVEIEEKFRTELIAHLRNFIDEDYDYFKQFRILEISVSLAYDEKASTLKKRLRKIEQLMDSSGYSNDQYVINSIGKKPLFICEYCDGCHYYFLKGTGYTLDKKSYKASLSDEKKDSHLAQRRAVSFTWVEK